LTRDKGFSAKLGCDAISGQFIYDVKLDNLIYRMPAVQQRCSWGTNMISRTASLRICLTTNVLIAAISAPAFAQAPKPNGILLAAGDIAQCGNDAYKQDATADLISKEISDPANAGVPILVLALGDLAYPKGRKKDFDCFDKSWGKFVVRILPVPGNHEYEKDPAHYFNYFKQRNRNMVSENGPKAGYYSLNFPKPEDALNKDAKPWHLIALNSGSGGVGPGQVEWLKNDLKSNDQRCVLAFAHHFVFSSGRHGHEPPDYEKLSKEENLKKKYQRQNKMVNAFRTLHASGASLFLSGHDHHYEEFKPQDADGNAVDSGLRSFIVGTGGAYLYSEPYEHVWKNSEKDRRQAESYGILKLELFDDSYQWRFVPTADAKNLPEGFDAPRTGRCNTRVSLQ
jgi:hypothetical protein